MPAENGLPQYVSKHARTGIYQYYRRPPKGVTGSAFVRSFGSKDRKAVMSQYAAIHAEAEAYFARLTSGRIVPDGDLKFAALAMILGETVKDGRPLGGKLVSSAEFRERLIQSEGDLARHLSDADMNRLIELTLRGYYGVEADRAAEVRADAEAHATALRKVAPALTSKTAFTLKDGYEQAWKPAKVRGKNTVVEVGRYVDEFEALNGKLDLRDYTREHWAAWRKDCLEKHGPGPTAFKRFSMMKTVVNESIRAGLFERKFFAGQDVSMTKTKSKKLRNEGWLAEELVTWFSAPLFRGSKTSTPRPDADYWISVIIAHTGARLSEVTGMQVADVAERHGIQTFYLAREHGKTDDSRRIIPIPKAILALGFLDYLATRPKNGALFENVKPKLMSQTYGRMRADLGLTRRGCDVHAHRHHIRTVLRDLQCPDAVADYVTGHAPPNVSGTYGKTQFQTALRFLDQVDLGVTIPKWKPST
jgi:integrase